MVDHAALQGTQTINQAGNKQALTLWYHTLMSTVRDEDSPDLSARQMAILLTIATQSGPHTLRALSERLNISKPAICRALDSLSRMKMAQRVIDKQDRRNVFIMPTEMGIRYLANLSETIMTQLLEIA